MLKMTVALFAGLLVTLIVLNDNGAVSGQEDVKSKGTKASTTEKAATHDNAAIENPQAADEAAIRKNVAAFVKAYQAGDAKALAEQFVEDAECVHESNLFCRGRATIEQTLTEFFEANPGCKLQKTIDSIRFVTPDVAIEDGTTICECSDGSSCVTCAYTTVHVKKDGKWLVASIQDRDSRDLKEHSLKLDQLAWLQGDWIDEGGDAVVHFSCQPIANGNFLMRSFTIEVAGQEAMTGTQRIGWDPLTGNLRTWIFDSSGSFGEGVWYRADGEGTVDSDEMTAVAAAEETGEEDATVKDTGTNDAGKKDAGAKDAGTKVADAKDTTDDTTTDDTGFQAKQERWILKVNGVLADGKTASSTSVYTIINDHTMTWQSVDHEIAGVYQPDSEIITIVRKAAPPEATAATE